jgi:hypothetical protein
MDVGFAVAHLGAAEFEIVVRLLEVPLAKVVLNE